MKKKRAKSLGTLDHPSANLLSYRGQDGEAVILLDAGARTVKIKLGVYCVRTLLRLAHEIVAKQGEYARSEWGLYQHIAKLTHYEEPKP